MPRGLLLTRCAPAGRRRPARADGPELVSPHQLVLVGAVKKMGGVVARAEGDLAQLVFSGPEKALACALALLRRFERYNREREDPAEKVCLTQAAHRAVFKLEDGGVPAEHGEVLERLLEVTPAGRIFCTRAAYAPVLGKAPFEFIPLGWEHLPGLRAPVDVLEVVPHPWCEEAADGC